MSALIDALRRKYKTPREAMTALGLDADLLGARLGLDAAPSSERSTDMTVQLSPKAALAQGTILGHFAPKLKTAGMAMDAAADLLGPIFSGITSKNYAAQRPVVDAAVRAALKGRLASDAEIEDVTELLRQIEGVEAGADTTTEANAGVPPYMREDPEDADDETPEERREDEACDRRARDAKDRLGRDATDEEVERLEEEGEDPPEGRRPEAEDSRYRKARDARRMRRAADAKRLLGRDESEAEREEREKREEANDRARAKDRHRMGRDYRKARDAHRAARDAHRRAAADWRRASDAHREAMDRRSADDAARHARDMKSADDKAREAHDAMVKARDARHKARDARRAHDKMHGMDDPPAFSGMPRTGGEMEPITKEAMDAAISDRVADAIAANDRKHREIAEARSVVRPKAGEIAMDGAINSAADVYARALDVLGVDHAGIRDALALRRMFELVPSRTAAGPGSGLVFDAAPASAGAAFKKMFPNAAPVERV